MCHRLTPSLSDYPLFLNGWTDAFAARPTNNEHPNPIDSIVQICVYEVNIAISAVRAKLDFHCAKLPLIMYNVIMPITFQNAIYREAK